MADLALVERELCRIPEVRAARIVAGDDGRPVEVHVLAAPGKAPKQVVRDVQSVALAANGLDLDHRIVSVVQLDEGNGSAAVALEREDAGPVVARADVEGGAVADRPAPAAPAGVAVADDRVVLESALVRRRGVRATAEVLLHRGPTSARGEAEGPAATTATVRLVAEAALEALRGVDAAAGRAALETATVVRLGDREVALASLVVVVPPGEEIVCGAAPVRGAGPDDAVARAVLDAANRRFPVLG